MIVYIVYTTKECKNIVFLHLLATYTNEPKSHITRHTLMPCSDSCLYGAVTSAVRLGGLSPRSLRLAGSAVLILQTSWRAPVMDTFLLSLSFTPSHRAAHWFPLSRSQIGDFCRFLSFVLPSTLTPTTILNFSFLYCAIYFSFVCV